MALDSIGIQLVCRMLSHAFQNVNHFGKRILKSVTRLPLYFERHDLTSMAGSYFERRDPIAIILKGMA
jgi:hypothetical protein